MNTTKSISCLIVDDELSSQRVLQHFIKETAILDLKATCSNTAEAFKYLQLHSHIALLFLDINMPQESGLDFYKSLKNPPQVIFTTAYAQYAVDGFEVNAVDYLLKPIAYNRFLTAIHKVLNNEKTAQSTDDFIVLKENKALHKIPKQFLRIHKSFSINLNKMNHLSGNKITVDTHTIPIGQTYKQTILKALNL